MKFLFTILLLGCYSFAAISQYSSPESIAKAEGLKVLSDAAFTANFNGSYSNSLKTTLSLINLAEELGDSYYLHRGYSILGYNYLVQGDTLAANESFKKSETNAKLSKNPSAKGRTYLDIANLYCQKEDLVPKSIPYYAMAIKNLEQAKDSSGLAAAHYYAIVASLNIGDDKKALEHITSINSYLGNIENNNFCEISVNSQIAKYHTRQNNFKIADKYYKSVIADSKEKEYWQELEDTYQEYSESLIAQGRLKESIEAQKEYFKYYKINENARRSEENKQLTAAFEVEKYKKEAKEAKIEKAYLGKLTQSKNRFLFWLALLSAALLASFIFLLFIFKKRKKLNASLRIQNKKYAEEKKKAEQLSKSKSAFLATVSHELRTPLYGVIGLSSIFLDDYKMQHQKENLKSLKFSADYLLALINDVLQLNKLDAPESTAQKSTFCIRKLAATMTSSFQYKRNQNNNTLTLDIDPETPDLIAGNESYLSQILMNIIGNAHKFTENGEISLSIKPIKRYGSFIDLEFAIKDTGIGIPEEKQKNIFDEFAQVSSGVHLNQQGTGLGLSIVKKLIHSMGSHIKVQSKPGVGSTFTFVISFDFITQKIAHDYIAPTILSDTSILKDKKILIVDDNAINRVVTEKILEKVDVLTDQAVNGEEAVKLALKNTYDLILMDINMPVKDGIQATGEIRRFNRRVPIIALTAVELDDMKDAIYESGMNDIVLKPYNTIEFHNTLIRAIGNANYFENIAS